jgi:hypothetical protein
MNFKQYHSLIKEGFDLTGYLTNSNFPVYHTISDVLNDFEKLGGKVLGTGMYGNVLSHPSWNYVCKIYSDDPCYTRYIRFCMRNQNREFCPKILDKPRKILPNYTRTSDTQNLYIVKLEKLQPLSGQSSKIASELEFLSYYFLEENMMFQNLKRVFDKTLEGYQREYFPEEHQDKLELFLKHVVPISFSWINYVRDLMISGTKECRLDLHSGNVMTRNDGSLVIVDPIAVEDSEATTFYKRGMSRGMSKSGVSGNKHLSLRPKKKFKFPSKGI